MSGLDMRALRAAAEAATPGPWTFEAEGDYECGEPGCCSEYWDNRIWGGGVVIAESHLTSADDSTHIAAFDPPTALALLDRLEATEAILNSEQFTWLMVGDPDWAQAHVAAIRPAWHQWLSDRADERNRR